MREPLDDENLLDAELRSKQAVLADKERRLAEARAEEEAEEDDDEQEDEEEQEEED